MSLNWMILCSKLKNGLWKIVTKSQVVTEFEVTKSRLHFLFRKLFWPTARKTFANSRLEAENLQKFWNSDRSEFFLKQNTFKTYVWRVGKLGSKQIFFRILKGLGQAPSLGAYRDIYVSSSYVKPTAMVKPFFIAF